MSKLAEAVTDQRALNVYEVWGGRIGDMHGTLHVDGLVSKGDVVSPWWECGLDGTPGAHCTEVDGHGAARRHAEFLQSAGFHL